MGPENVDDVDEAFRAITNAQYTVSKMWVFDRWRSMLLYYKNEWVRVDFQI